MNKEKKVFISGNFNILHPGHLRLFRFAKELCDYLVVGVNSDKIAGAAAHVPEDLRLEAVESNTWVSKAFIINEPIEDILKVIKPHFVVKGKEHQNKYNPESEVLNAYGGKLVFSSGEVVFSSFDLINKELLVSKKNFLPIPERYYKRHGFVSQDLVSIINSFKKLNVIVLGDVILDEYINCDPLGMSQEDPTIVVTPIESKMFLGGAAIVAAHAAGLGANVKFVSVTGNDNHRNYVFDKLKEFNVKATLFPDESRPTTLKQRYRCRTKTLLRVSHLHQGAIDSSLQELFLREIQENLDSCDLLIFSDFNYGCLPTEMVLKIIKITKQKRIPMVADSQSSSQVGDISRFVDMEILTPTEREARLSVRDMESGLVVLAQKLRTQTNAKNVLLKIGQEGVLVHAEADNEEGWLTDRIPALNLLAVDVAGAGDSMLVAGALSLATGAQIWQSAALGSLAAAVQVSRVGNIPIQANELLEQLFT